MILIVNFQKNDPEQHFAKQIIITKVQYYLGLVGGSKKIFGQKISIPEMVWNGQKIGQITVKDQGSISLTLLGQFVLVFLVVQSEMNTSGSGQENDFGETKEFGMLLKNLNRQ